MPDLEIVLFTVLFIFTIVASILLFVFFFIVLTDCLKRSFKSDTEKILWILFILVAPIFGALLYYFLIKKKDPRLSKPLRKSLRFLESFSSKSSKRKF